MAGLHYFITCDLCRESTDLGTVDAVPTTWARVERVGFTLHVCSPCRVAILEDGVKRGVVVRNSTDDTTK